MWLLVLWALADTTNILFYIIGVKYSVMAGSLPGSTGHFSQGDGNPQANDVEDRILQSFLYPQSANGCSDVKVAFSATDFFQEVCPCCPLPDGWRRLKILPAGL